MKIKVFVTGSEGFVGKELVKKLKAENIAVEGFDLVNGENVLDVKQLNSKVESFNPSYIIHLAGQVLLKPSLIDPINDAETNILGTLNILQTALSHHANVVFSSSGAVYGSNDRSHVNELHSAEPVSPYGVSKLTAEKYCMLYNYLYSMSNIVFRFSSIYGVGRKKTSINLIVDKAVKQVNLQNSLENKVNYKISITGDGSQTRDFTHVSDVVEAFWMSVHRRFHPDIYNIGTGTSTSINQLIRIIEELLGHKLIVDYVERNLADPSRNDFDVSKARLFGFKTKVGLRQGVERLISEYNI